MDEAGPHEPSGGEALLGGDRQLTLRWQVEDYEDFRLRCTLFADAGALLVAERELRPTAPRARIDLSAIFDDPNISHGEIELRFSDPGRDPRTVTLAGCAISLWCNIPLGRSSWYRSTLETWPATPGPGPEPDPDLPPPDPFDPFIDNRGHALAPWGGVIEPDPPGAGVLEFLWLEEAVSEDNHWSFVAFADGGAESAELPLVQTLSTIREANAADPAKALTEMQAAAAKFLAANWPPTAAQEALGQTVVDLLDVMARNPDEMSLEEAQATAKDALGVSVDAFCTEQVVPADGLFSLVWQLLYALALAAPLAQAPTAPPGLVAALADLGELARCARALSLVIRLAAGDSRPCDPRSRRELLRALTVAPTGIQPPVPPGGQAVQVLGAGVQKTIEQHLEGYRLGEIAEVVNLMPGERLELVERERRKDASLQRDDARDSRDTTHEDRRTGESTVLQGLRDALSQAEIVRDYTNLDADRGDWPDLKIGGSWWGQDGGQTRDIDRAATYIQGLSRSVATTIGARVIQERSVFELREHETSETRAIDNRRSGFALRGVYHWLEKVHHLRLVSNGRRLVVEVLLASPGGPLMERTLQRPNLEPPLPPATWKISDSPAGYDSVTPDNYANAAAAYCLNLPPPQPDSVTVRTHLCSQQPTAQIVIPEGYAASGLTVAYAIVDASTPFIALAGAQAVTFSGGGAELASPPGGGAGTTSTPPSIPDPQTYSWSPAKPATATGVVKFPSPVAGMIPLACIYGGGAFDAIAEAVCDATGDAVALTRWKIETHRAILAAYDALRIDHEAALRRGILAQAHEGVGRLVSTELTLAGVAALFAAAPQPAPVAGSGPTSSPGEARFLTDALDWADATYAFYPWGVDPLRRPSPVRWTGQTLSDRNDPAWLDSFLEAASARVLVTVRPGHEAAVLFFLAFGYLPVRPDAVLVPETAQRSLAALRAFLPIAPDRCWRLQVPTPHAALADGPHTWLESGR